MSSSRPSQPSVHRQPAYLASTAASVKPPLTSIPKETVPPQQTDFSVDIHSYPSPDLLRLLASLLTQIASTNDKLDAASSSTNGSPSSPVSPELSGPIWNSLTTASRSALSTHSSTLTFHARNIPTISLEAYLLRILKYCPTTNEVFLSLLVYFDRMTKLTSEATGRSFVIDSYNIHRLVIAGVTVASKFFSDVFYTNSRYAKVGGLPLTELNQLELQFLLLNNFTLVIPKDEMQRYAEQLILFSSNNSPPGTLPTLSSSVPPSASVTDRLGAMSPAPSVRPDIAPMRSMGAIDAYGGRIPNGELHASTSTSQLGGVLMARQGEDSESETGGDTETETETETETDGESWTTDDEPTIRPPKSSIGSSSSSSRSSGASDARSICSSLSESDSGEGDDERDDLAMDDDDEEAGGRTPEHGAHFEGVKDGEKTPERLPFNGVLEVSKRTPPGRTEHDGMASP
ncbi:cyclin-domain-containing protein [Rhodocollybia butyracea]|uniref:Cyclin-domain-containing protein n=1 Tax=Rhodocollybia butyracea TaxID=206335 RepID=A0A9P5UEW2_9AGAR|nr:cyclin-domain-containing protein [Rhodocollybia butyracea]